MPLSQNAYDSLTHIVSILAIASMWLGAVGIIYHFETHLDDGQFAMLMILGATAVSGASYYAIKFAITPSGVNVETDPTKK